MATLQSYQDTTIKQDISPLMMALDITSTQLYSGLKKSTAYAVTHEWLVDEVPAVSVNAKVEGADFSSITGVTPTRAQNYTQVFTKDVQVSDTEIAVNHFEAVGDPMAHQTTKQMKTMKGDIELALMRSTLITGNAGVARQMAGVFSWITTNATAFNSGTTLTETILNDLIELTWNAGGEADEIYVGSKLKRRISGFTAGATKYKDVTDKRLVNSVDVYESDFGVHKIFKHRYAQLATDTTANIVILDSSRWVVSELKGRSPFIRDISKTGDSEKKQLVAELTLECHQEKANAKASGLLIG